MMVTPLLMAGGAFLCFEGCEKILHSWLHRDQADAAAREHCRAALNPSVNLAELERDKVKGAIRTDFILSAEIIVIALGTLADASATVRVAVLSCVSIAMTVGVYGLVAAIVKLDDAGLWLSERARQHGSALQLRLGQTLLVLAPRLMRFLSVAGTSAMFLVGGGILSHGIGPVHHMAALIPDRVAAWPLAPVWSMLLPLALDALVGVLTGLAVVACVLGVHKIKPASSRGSR
jgi:predicted DNA repair protein MutK